MHDDDLSDDLIHVDELPDLLAPHLVLAKEQGRQELLAELALVARLNGDTPDVLKAMGEREQPRDLLSFLKAKPAKDAPHAAIAEAMLRHAGECVDAGTDPTAGLAALASLADDPEGLGEVVGATVKKSLGDVFFKAGRYDEKLHPRGKNGRFISKLRLQEAADDPHGATAKELRKEVKPEDKAKLEHVIANGVDHIGRTKVGERRHRSAAKKQARKLLYNDATELVQKLASGEGDAADVQKLSDHLTATYRDGGLTADHVSNLQTYLGGGGRTRAAMVAALLEHARQATEGDEPDQTPPADSIPGPTPGTQDAPGGSLPPLLARLAAAASDPESLHAVAEELAYTLAGHDANSAAMKGEYGEAVKAAAHAAFDNWGEHKGESVKRFEALGRELGKVRKPAKSGEVAGEPVASPPKPAPTRSPLADRLHAHVTANPGVNSTALERQFGPRVHGELEAAEKAGTLERRGTHQWHPAGKKPRELVAPKPKFNPHFTADDEAPDTDDGEVFESGKPKIEDVLAGIGSKLRPAGEESASDRAKRLAELEAKYAGVAGEDDEDEPEGRQVGGSADVSASPPKVEDVLAGKPLTPDVPWHALADATGDKPRPATPADAEAVRTAREHSELATIRGADRMTAAEFAAAMNARDAARKAHLEAVVARGGDAPLNTNLNGLEKWHHGNPAEKLGRATAELARLNARPPHTAESAAGHHETAVAMAQGEGSPAPLTPAGIASAQSADRANSAANLSLAGAAVASAADPKTLADRHQQFTRGMERLGLGAGEKARFLERLAAAKSTGEQAKVWEAAVRASGSGKGVQSPTKTTGASDDANRVGGPSVVASNGVPVGRGNVGGTVPDGGGSRSPDDVAVAKPDGGEVGSVTELHPPHVQSERLSALRQFTPAEEEAMSIAHEQARRGDPRDPLPDTSDHAGERYDAARERADRMGQWHNSKPESLAAAGQADAAQRRLAAAKTSGDGIAAVGGKPAPVPSVGSRTSPAMAPASGEPASSSGWMPGGSMPRKPEPPAMPPEPAPAPASPAPAASFTHPHNAEVVVADRNGKKEKMVAWPFRRDTAKAIAEGTITADELRQRFDALTADPAATKAHLADALKKTGMRSPEKIKDQANVIYERALSTFAPGKSVSFMAPLGQGPAAWEAAKIDAHREAVHSITDDDLKAHAASLSESRAETQKTLTNPETANEFREFIHRRGESALTPEQSAKWDELQATERRSHDAEERARRAVVTGFAPGAEATGDVGIVEGHHQKRNAPTFTVTVANRLGDEKFKDAVDRAKRLGGSYVNAMIAKRYGATPGFQFFDKDKADQFAGVLRGESVDRSADLAQTDAERAANRATGLTERGESLAGAGQADLERDRQTNTARRAAMAAGAEGRARTQIATGRTLAKLGDAMGTGDLKHLHQIRNAADVDTLNRTLNRARWDRYRAAQKADPTARIDPEQFTAAPHSEEDVTAAEYPYPKLWTANIRSLANSIKDEPGLKRLAASLAKHGDTTPKFKTQGGGMKFNGGQILTADALKEHGLHTLVPDGKQVRVHTSYDWRLAQQGKGHGPFYTADAGKSFGTSPEVAVSAAASRGNPLDTVDAPDDKLVSITHPHDIDTLRAIVGKARNHPNKDVKRVGERLADDLEHYNRLQRMDIKSPAELRAALREYVPLKQSADREDPVKAQERKLIGRKIPGFFPTPRPTVDAMLDRADIQPGHSVLEPSAGKGDILDAVRERHPDAQTHAVEPVGELRDILTAKGHTLAGSDFLQHAGQYDRVVMNPPFENGQDIDHVRHAYEQLKPGGKMVAIMSAGPFGRQDKKSAEFRDWLGGVGGEAEQMPEGSFAGSDAFRQTGVRTRMVTVEKPHGAAQHAAMVGAGGKAEHVEAVGRAAGHLSQHQSANLPQESVSSAVDKPAGDGSISGVGSQAAAPGTSGGGTMTDHEYESLKQRVANDELHPDSDDAGRFFEERARRNAEGVARSNERQAAQAVEAYRPKTDEEIERAADQYDARKRQAAGKAKRDAVVPHPELSKVPVTYEEMEAVRHAARWGKYDDAAPKFAWTQGDDVGGSPRFTSGPWRLKKQYNGWAVFDASEPIRYVNGRNANEEVFDSRTKAMRYAEMLTHLRMKKQSEGGGTDATT